MLQNCPYEALSLTEINTTVSHLQANIWHKHYSSVFDMGISPSFATGQGILLTRKHRHSTHCHTMHFNGMSRHNNALNIETEVTSHKWTHQCFNSKHTAYLDVKFSSSCCQSTLLMSGMVLSQVYVGVVVEPEVCTLTYLHHYAFQKSTSSTRTISECYNLSRNKYSGLQYSPSILNLNITLQVHASPLLY
jgi:hypothetical protein